MCAEGCGDLEWGSARRFRGVMIAKMIQLRDVMVLEGRKGRGGVREW